MTTSADHYEHLLAPIYLWMAGGAQAAMQAGRAEIESLASHFGPWSSVVDLGAGFGMHAIPMAQAGAAVLAIDSSALLLQTLNELRGGVQLRAVCGDLLAFPSHLTESPDAILCMGDTITHLPDVGAVSSLIQNASSTLKRGGAFVVSLRDYSIPLLSDQRFVPVRSDDTRLLTCFLEYQANRVVVHDIVNERKADGWTTRVSHYFKLRLPIDDLMTQIDSAGFKTRREDGVRGLVRLIATKR